MSKAVLVIDMPENCKECALGYDLYDCYILGEATFNGRHKNCPLKKLPSVVANTSISKSGGLIDEYYD